MAPHLHILEIFRVIGAKPHHHGKVADRGGDLLWSFNFKKKLMVWEKKTCDWPG